MQPPSVEPLRAQILQPAPATQTAQLDTLSCTSIGPFADLPQAAQAQAALRAAGFQPRQRVEQGELWVGYWVSVQGLATRDAAEAALKTLNANGITDVYLMPGSDPANVLSLGVFSDYQRAQRRADEVRALGLQPRIDDRKRAGSVYWIDVDLPEPGQLIDSSMFQTRARQDHAPGNARMPGRHGGLSDSAGASLPIAAVPARPGRADAHRARAVCGPAQLPRLLAISRLKSC